MHTRRSDSCEHVAALPRYLAQWSSIQFDDSDEIESGGGISAQIGWGFTKNCALLFDLSGAAISTGIADVGPGHAELTGRWHFANESRALLPFLEVGFAGRAIM